VPDADAETHAQRRDRAVVRGALSAAAVRVLTAGASFVALGITARVLSVDEFGLVAVLTSVLIVLTMFDFGLGGALSVRVARSHGQDDLPGIRAHVDHALIALTGVGAIIAIGGTISTFILPWHDWIGGTLEPAMVTRCVIITFVLSGASLPVAVGFLALAGMQRFTAAQSSIAVGSVAAVVATAVVAPLNPSPELLLLTILGTPLVASFGFTLWTRLGILRGHGSFGLDVPQMLSMLKVSGWFALYSIANTVTLATGTMIVGSMVGLAEAGVFSVAVRLFSPMITVIQAAGLQLRPGMTEAIARGDVAWARSRYKRGLLAVAVPGVALSLLLVVLGRWFCRIWVGQDLVPSLSLLAWTAALMVTTTLASQAAGVVIAVERVRPAAVLAVATAVASLAGSILLARELGTNGAMIGALAAAGLIFVPGIALLARGTLRSLDAVDVSGR
jgi:O-antigen/teichoic acid export membrane protein